MYGSWFMISIGAVLAVLFAIGLAFGTSALILGPLIAAAIVAAAGLFILLRSSARSAQSDQARPRGPRNPRSGGAPVSGEGSPGS
jgi:hypothetical protein